MTEYEMADLFATWGAYLELFLERFLYLVFAFLVTAYLVGSKLKPALVVIVVALYSYMALRYVVVYFNVIDDQIALAEQIRASIASGNSDLAWLGISESLSTILNTQALAMFLSYIASLVFFFYSRHSATSERDNAEIQ